MSELPQGWASTNLERLFEFKYGKSLVKEKRHADGLINVFGSNGVVGTHNEAITQGPTIIIGRKGSVGEINFSLSPCWPIDTTYYIDEFLCDVPPAYWSFYLKSLRLGEWEKSSAIPGISRADIYRTQIEVPPLNEQRRIAAKLNKLLTRVGTAQERLATVPRILKRFRQAVIDAAAAGTLTFDWRADRGVESEYLTGTLGNLARFVDYRGKTPQKTSVGIPLLTAKNIRPGYLSIEPREYIAENGYDDWMTRGIPRLGDVLITTEAPLGYVVCIDWTFKFALAQRVICLQFDNDMVLGEYASLVLQSTDFQYALRQKATGTTVVGIKASRLKELSINFPRLDEQAEIVRRVNVLFKTSSEVEARYLKARTHVDKLIQSILAKAFRGELVSQDPNDEPASILLDRIRQQRNGAGATTTRSKIERSHR